MTRTWIRSMVLAAGVGSLTAVSPAHAAEPSSPTPAEALARLKDGNARFVAGRSQAVPMDAPRRNELLASQHPFAIVLSCADSRVPPELVFNVGLGDLFVIRTAGEVADRAVLASVEYAVEHLHTPLLLVMGHQSCGAVQAASEPHTGSLGPNLDYLVHEIEPAVARTAAVPADARMKAAIMENIEQVIHESLTRSAILKHAVQDGHLQMVGGFYELATGTVTFTKPTTADAVHTAHVRK